MSDMHIPTDDLDYREQLASIDQKLSDAARKRQEITLEPWKLVIAALTAGAAIFAAGGAWFKLLDSM